MKNKRYEKLIEAALTEIEEKKQEDWETAVSESGKVPSEWIRKTKRGVARRRLGCGLRRAGHAVALFFLVLLGSGILALSVSKTARAAFERWTHDIFDGRIRYLFYGKPEEEYKLPQYEAGWLPEGVKLVEKKVGSFNESYDYWYQNEDGSIIILFGVRIVTEGSLLELTQMEGYDHETICFEGRTIEDYFLGETDRTALWFEDDDRAVIIIDCYLTREELLTFIKNLKRVN